MPFFSHDQWNDEDRARFPALRRLFDNTTACKTETFWNFASAFEDFFRSDFLSTFLSREISEIARLKDYDCVQSDEEVELVRGVGFRISMGKISASSPLARNYSEIVCYASDFMYANLGPCPLDVELFEFPGDRDIEYFERNVQPISVGRWQQGRDEIVRARAGIDVLKVSPPPHDTYQIYAVSLKPKVPLLWHFDSTTLWAKYCTSANLMSSRTQTGIDILVRMKCLDAIPQIIDTAKSKDHFVRWTAIASVACLDQVKGIQLLQDALSDPHPDVRSAARSALHLIKPKTGI